MPRMKLTEHLNKEKAPRKSQTSKQMLYNFDWQLLRVRLDFSTTLTTQESLDRVKAYVEPGENLNKVWRALNLMAATRMGFSGLYKLIKKTEKLEDLELRDKLVLDYREWLTLKRKELESQGQTTERVSEIDQFKDLKEASVDEFADVYASLTFRYENSSRSAARPDLKRYLELMQIVLFLYHPKEYRAEVFKTMENKFRGLRKNRKALTLDWATPCLLGENNET
jgi:hypothetical protein